jgi:hypothetical protein
VFLQQTPRQVAQGNIVRRRLRGRATLTLEPAQERFAAPNPPNAKFQRFDHVGDFQQRFKISKMVKIEKFEANFGGMYTYQRLITFYNNYTIELIAGVSNS